MHLLTNSFGDFFFEAMSHDPEGISDPFVSEKEELLWAMAEAETQVDVHDVKLLGVELTTVQKLTLFMKLLEHLCLEAR